MSEERKLICVGGPMAGTWLRTPANVVRIEGYPDMEYVRTRPTDTNWRDTWDHDWFIHGLDKPPPVPDHVLEWHKSGWESPEVASIRAAVGQ